MELLAVEDQMVFGIDREENLFVYKYNEERIAKIGLNEKEENQDFDGWQVTHQGTRLLGRKNFGCSSTTLILLDIGIK